MVLKNIWFQFFIFYFLFYIITCNENEIFEKISISYISKIDEKFYPSIPQLIKMVARQRNISNYFNSYKKLIKKLPNEPKNWMFDHIKEELEIIEKNMNENIDTLIRNHQIKFLKDSKKKEFFNFLNELNNIYNDFGFDKICKIYIKIKDIGDQLKKYLNLNEKKILIQLEDNWNRFLDEFQDSKNNNSILELKRKLDSAILSHFIEKEAIKKEDFNVKEFTPEFSNKFWEGHLSYNNLIKFFDDYTIYQLNIIYKLRLTWIKIILSILFINIDNIFNDINNLASKTMVHTITLTSLQHLNHIENRINTFLYKESYINKLLDIYNNLSLTMNIWMNWTLVLEDLQYLYNYLIRESFEIKNLITNIFEKIINFNEINIINTNDNNSNNNKYMFSIKISKYLRNIYKIDDISELKKVSFLDITEKKDNYKLLKEEEIDNNSNSLFEEMTEKNIILEIENLLINNKELFQEFKEINNLLDNLNNKFQRFNRQSNIFLIELKSTSSNCQLLFLATTQSGNSLYEILANDILNISNDSNEINRSSNNKLDVLIKDLEPIKNSIRIIKETEKVNEPTDIFGEMITDEDFIYVPNNTETSKKTQTSGYLFIRISIIVGLLLLAIILYIYKDRILIKKVHGTDKETEFNERYCSRASLEELEFESTQSEDEEYELLKKRYYKLDRKSGNIILRHNKN